MLPPKSCVFPAYQASICSPFTLMVLVRHRSVSKTFVLDVDPTVAILADSGGPAPEDQHVQIPGMYVLRSSRTPEGPRQRRWRGQGCLAALVAILAGSGGPAPER